MRKYKTALLGYYGFGNLGDELLLEACLEMMASCGVKRESIVVLSNDPGGTSVQYGVDSVNRWSFRDVVRALRESGTLLLGGGGLFQDSSSVMSCVWYWGVVRLARMLGCRVWAVGQSVGPLRSGVSRCLAGSALRSCVRLHVRDERSLRLAESLGCRDVITGSDLVMTLKPQTHNSHKSYMLVNLRPCQNLNHFTDKVLPIIYSKNIRVVGAALSDEDAKALAALSPAEIVRVKSLGEAAELWAGASCAVGMRLHFGVLSRMFGTPLALMPYDSKVSEFASQSGVPCIIDEWQEPVMPLPVPNDSQKINSICCEVLGL